MYDLGFEASDPDEDESMVLNDMATENFNTEKSVPPDADGAVKVLSEKTGSVDNFQKNGVDLELVPLSIEGLSDEFRNMQQIN